MIMDIGRVIVESIFENGSENQQNPTKNVDLQAILRWLSEATLYFPYAGFIHVLLLEERSDMQPKYY